MALLTPDLPAQIRAAWSLAAGVRLTKRPSAILVCGMGGSGFAGDLLKDALSAELKIPLAVTKGVHVPAWVGKGSVVFAISYSGKTKETLAAAQHAKSKGADVIAISSDVSGLKRHAGKAVEIPKGFLPREAVAYLFFPLLRILHDSRLIEPKNKAVMETVRLLEKDSKKITSLAATISKKLLPRIPVIWTPPGYHSVGVRFQHQLNENAKLLAHHSSFTELCHNEVEADLKKAFVLLLTDNGGEHKKYIRATARFVPKDSLQNVELQGRSKLARLMWAVALAQEVSLKAAELRGVDARKTSKIDRIKKEVGHGGRG